ncbi:MAG: serine/threonine-protein kinase [Planctomycetota bacterium]
MPTLEEIESLFHEVRCLDPAERESFLKSRCGDNDALFHRLSVMLKLDSEDHAVLDDLTRASTAVESERATPSDKPVEKVRVLPSGAKIDHFTIVREIGRGGMGIVYEAHQQTPIERRVAIKVMQQQAVRSVELERRFIQEKRALSRLQHPNITTIFDAGVDLQGHLYFVMEFIDGMEVTEFADAQQLTILQRIEMAEQICRAIHHAHQRGILHLDIKPSNLLVHEMDDGQTPKVIDFGISEAIQAIESIPHQGKPSRDSDLLNDQDGDSFKQVERSPSVATTNAEDLVTKSKSDGPRGAVGTPCYMSPEHLRMVPGELDVRADVFSLGVVLYELAVGTCPLRRKDADRGGWREVVDAIRDCNWTQPIDRWREYGDEETASFAEKRSMKPREIERVLNGEFGAIVAKCIHKDPDNRYESAAALARDLSAFLESRPLDAMPLTLRYQTAKLYQRNRLSFSAAAMLAALVLVISVVTTWLAYKNDRLRSLADRRAVQLQARETQLATANQGLKLALDRAVTAEKEVRSNLEEKRRAAAIERAGSRYALQRASIASDNSTVPSQGQPTPAEQNPLAARSDLQQLPRLDDFLELANQVDPSSTPQMFSFGGIPVQISNSSAEVSIVTTPLTPQGKTLEAGIPTDAYLAALIEFSGGRIEELQSMVADELRDEFGETHEIYQEFLRSIETSR